MRRATFFALLSGLALSTLSACSSGGASDPPAGAAPTATSAAATSIGETGATLNGVVNPGGLETRVWFEYGPDAGLGTSTPTRIVVAGSSAVPVTATLTGLASGTSYSFRLRAENGAGHSEGEVLTFDTASPGTPPAVTTGDASAVGATSASLSGTVIPNGLATSAWFEWGTDSTLASSATTEPRAMGSATVSQAFDEELTGLGAGTTYYYRAVASSSAGRTDGAIASFTTGSLTDFRVVATSPADGATGVPLDSLVTVTFSQDVEPASLVDGIAVASAGGEIAGVISYNATTRTATFAPAAPLAPSTRYAVTVAAKVKSVTTVRLTEPYVFGFTTGAGP